VIAELCLLQGFELRSDGIEVHLSMSSQRVLAFLAVHERPLQRSYVAGCLWSDTTEDRASASLRSALWRLPHPARALVDCTRGRVGLRSIASVDVISVIAQSHHLADQTVPQLLTLAARLEKDLLPDWYDDWVVEWRERWRQIRLHALEAVARILSACGAYDRAIEAGLAAVRADPLRESAHRAVIAAHLAEGNAEEALRQFRLYECRLLDELAIRPSSKMVDLIRGVASP
jgi:DNA-binding SARP family transcriptional activator